MRTRVRVRVAPSTACVCDGLLELGSPGLRKQWLGPVWIGTDLLVPMWQGGKELPRQLLLDRKVSGPSQCMLIWNALLDVDGSSCMFLLMLATSA
jgi:hypothetical protein